MVEGAEYAAAARAYCAWVEKPAGDPIDDLGDAFVLLASLYSQALRLPTVEPDVAVVNEPPRNRVEWQTLLPRFEHLPVGHYGEVFSPLVVPPETPVVGDLADDLADIYKDIKLPLEAYDSGQTSYAVWQWRFCFETHIGRHMLSALKAMHVYFEANGRWPAF